MDEAEQSPNDDAPRDTPNCPKCGSDKVWKAGKSVKAGGLTQRYTCTACGHVFVPGGD